MKTSKALQSNPAPEECGVWLDTVELKGKAKQKKTARPISKMLNPLAKGAGYSLAVVFNFTQTKTEMPRTKQSSISSFFSPRSKDKSETDMRIHGDVQGQNDERAIHCKIREEQTDEVQQNVHREEHPDELEWKTHQVREEQPGTSEQKSHYKVREEQADNIHCLVREEQADDMEQNIYRKVREEQADETELNIHRNFREHQPDKMEWNMRRTAQEAQPDEIDRNPTILVRAQQPYKMNRGQGSIVKMKQTVKDCHEFDLSQEAFWTEAKGKTSTQKPFQLVHSCHKDDEKENSLLRDDEDSLARMFTQDSDGFRVIAHRFRRSPLKNRNDVITSATMKPAKTLFDVEDALFTQDSQGNVVIKH
ncbi:aurora kinase A- and ninein-interacting protein [Phyllopteryx taeniolatus]|uniref:aurora kinase A- and ninein-interacting protein n=1 Tax=Phyllopteryx taeniolatus TaxID=161469 RepID=UPI002AD23242|nr:aurora kinase A- and ninein-interacting protein [Phyllopteryx taeniolatus]